MEDCGGGKEMDDWLEEQIQARFPDDLNIPPGQLRVRIYKLVIEYEQRLLGKYKGEDEVIIIDGAPTIKGAVIT